MADKQSFLQAVENSLPMYGNSPVTGKPRKSSSTVDLYDKKAFKNLQEELVKQALLQKAGLSDEEAAGPTTGIGNVSTAIPTDNNAYRITSGEEPVTSGNLSDMATANLSKSALTGLAAQQVADQAAASKPIGNISTDNTTIPKVDTSNIDKIISGESEPTPKDLADMGAPDIAKSALFDDRNFARQAQVPEETLKALFTKAAGSGYDDKSKKDRLMMNKIKDMIANDKSTLALSPAQFALKLYGRK